MAVAVVTDSTADIPAHIVERLGITVVPLNIHFGNELYRDGVDLTLDKFLTKLKESPKLPTTSQPAAGVFIETYTKLAEEGKDIISIHISQKLSGTYASARMAKESLGNKYRIEVVDSLTSSMGLGLIAISAARAARAGANIDEILRLVDDLTSRVHLMLFVDTLEYLQKGGRIGKAQALLGSLLNVKPLLTVKDGEIYPVERVRTRSKALSHLRDYVKNFRNIQELAILHSTSHEEVEALAQELESVFPRDRMTFATYGCVISTHIGPGAVGVFVVEGKD